MSTLKSKSKSTLTVAKKVIGNKVHDIIEEANKYLKDHHSNNESDMSCGVHIIGSFGDYYTAIKRHLGNNSLSAKDKKLLTRYFLLYGIYSDCIVDLDCTIGNSDLQSAFTLASLSSQCDFELIKWLDSFIKLSKNNIKTTSLTNPNSGNKIWIYIFDTREIIEEFNRLNKLIYNGR